VESKCRHTSPQESRVDAGRRIMHDLDMSSLVGTQSGWNKTILVFGDGRQVAVNHMGFSTGDEVDSFRKVLKGLNVVAPAPRDYRPRDYGLKGRTDH